MYNATVCVSPVKYACGSAFGTQSLSRQTKSRQYRVLTSLQPSLNFAGRSALGVYPRIGYGRSRNYRVLEPRYNPGVGAPVKPLDGQALGESRADFVVKHCRQIGLTSILRDGSGYAA